MKPQQQPPRELLGRTPYLLALFCIAALICGLLVVNYRSQHSLQQANIQRHLQDLQGHAVGISYFFSERENDARDLADSKSVTGFFANRDLGMTMTYGLLTSLNDVTRYFANHVEATHIGKDRIYTQLLLLDKNGQILSRWPTGAMNELQPVPREENIDKKKIRITSHSTGAISFTAPVILNDNLKGYVQGWVDYATIINNLLADTEGLLFVTDHGQLVFQSSQAHHLRADTVRKLHDQSAGWPLELPEEQLIAQAGAHLERDIPWTVFSAVIPGYDIHLLLSEKSSAIANRQTLYLFMTLLAILSVGIFLVATMILRASTKNLVLETSLAEAQKREKAIAEKKQELELIIDGTRLGTWNWHIPTGEFVLNERWAGMLGYRQDELEARIETWKDLVHPADRDRVQQTLQAHLDGKTSSYTAIYKLRHRQGNWIWVHSAGKVLTRDPNGAPLRALGIHLDITKQKEAQQLLTKAKEESDAIISNFLDTLIVVHQDLKVARVNQATCQLLGYSEEELIGKPITQFFHEPAELICSLFSFYKQPNDSFKGVSELRNMELCYRSRNGACLPMSFNINLLKDDTGTITGVVAGAKDISRLKAAMENVERQKEYIENLFQIVPEGLLALSPSMAIIERNRSFTHIIRNWAILFNLPEKTVIQEIMDKLNPMLPRTNHACITLTHGDVTAYLQYDSASVASIEGIQYVVSISDITSDREAEAARRLLATVIEQTTDSVIISETDGTIRYVNPATLTHTGYTAEELIGQDHNIFANGTTDPVIAQEQLSATTDGRTWSGRLTGRRKDGSIMEEDVTISPVRNEDGDLIHFVAVKRDMTEMALLQRQLLQAQKLEAIGQLAAGIAHEINTPMQYIKNNTTFLAESFAELATLLTDYQQVEKTQGSILGEEAREHLQELDLDFLMEEVPKALTETQEGINRVVKIVAAMKEFSHPGTGQKVASDINHILENTITVTRNEWKYVAEMVTDFAPDLPLVPCLPDQIKQVILNLIINGAQAIETAHRSSDPGKLGQITIRTRQDNERVEIQVSDTGCGIPDEIRERVYDPFFTTKEVGKGTGQGLTIIHNIVVKKHGGAIDFTSESGKGTTFFIRLPITDTDFPPAP